MSAQPRAGVLCAGTVLIDVAKIIDLYPAPEHVAMVGEVSDSTGGPGLNMAIDLRLLGADFPVSVLGAVGDDAHGALIRAECARLGLDTTALVTMPDLPTSSTDVMIEREGGRRTFFHSQGANGRLDFAAWDLAASPAKILHAGSPGLHARMDGPPDGGEGTGNGWSALFAAGQAAGLYTNLELVSVPAERMRAWALPCLPHLDSIVVNELEAAALLNVPAPDAALDGPVDWDGLEALARGLLDAGVSRLVVLHFPAGSVAAEPGGRTWRQGSVRVPRTAVRNTTGAGDAFAAGVLLGTHQEWPVQERLRLGVAAAAGCIRSPETSGGIVAAEVCLAEADQLGYRVTAG
ncbi:MAG: carbohydrate kinase family protein [Friedmanniella sp.]|nr:carbohydrate kinase family protein [Friedmanniella sp.]